MAKYVKYASYKATTITGLENIPEHWEIKQVRYLLLDGQEGIKIGPFGSALKLEDMVEVGYKVYGQENVIKKNFSLGKRWISANKFKAMQVYRVHSGDILITMMGTSGKCEIVPDDHQTGIIDSHLIRLGLQKNKMLPKFFKVLIDGTLEIEYQVKIQGKGSIMHGLNSSIIKSLELPIPPLVEQKDILNFLDYETAQIDTLIDKQQTLIQLLKEKRQAVISHAVTKGLNPDVPMKESGVEWLGDVPEHWEVTKAKYVSDIFIPQRNKPELNAIEGCPWVTMEDMKSQYIDEVHRYVKCEAMKESGSKVLKAGAVIASCVGNFGVTSINRVDVIINQQLQAFQPKRIKPEYLQAIVALSKSYFELIGTAATLIYVNREGFENLPVIVPTTQEQEAISKLINMKSKQFDSLVSKAEQAIKLMQERRTALISAAVTGKIDVRGWVAPESR